MTTLGCRWHHACGKMQYMTRISPRYALSRGFTIVELIIVVLIIAILATITVVAYHAVQDSAADAAVLSDLDAAYSQLATEFQQTGHFPDDASGVNGGEGFAVSEGNTIDYLKSGDWYCLQVSSSREGIGPVHQTSSTSSAQKGACPAAPPAALPKTMQAFTSTHCRGLAEYTGSNSGAIITLDDNRGGSPKTYEVAKLADGNCWMLTNLRLGSTTGPIVLSSSDSNIENTFTLPQAATPTIINQDEAHVVPNPSDTGVGATNYGYLYSFPAATAGGTIASLPANYGDAPYSICPAHWRLPSGGSTESDFAQLDIEFGGTGVYASGSPSVAKWQYSGPFKGVNAGMRGGSLVNIGVNGYLWTSSTYPGNSAWAYGFGVYANEIAPGTNGNTRSNAFAIRCLTS